MKLIVASKHHLCEVSTAIDVTGREHLVVVTKASWKIPAPQQRPRPLPPTSLCVADEYYGSPGESAMRCGYDFARFKPQCDVLFDAVAHVPGERPQRYLDVAVKVGSMRKQIQVVGPRVWQQGMLGLVATDPEPFTHMPLHYGYAFGGMRSYPKKDQVLYEAFTANPIGKGWAGSLTWHRMLGEQLPNLEHPREPVRSPQANHAPMALSAIAPAWSLRSQYGGTYDDAWSRDVAPFLPEDFDDRCGQCAPPDQQIAYPLGGEDVCLQNIVPGQPMVQFKLPPLGNMTVRVLRKDYSTQTIDAPADTIFFETESHRFSVVWRASIPVRRRIHEFDVIAVGSVNLQWWRDRSLGIDGHGCSGCASHKEAS